MPKSDSTSPRWETLYDFHLLSQNPNPSLTSIATVGDPGAEYAGKGRPDGRHHVLPSRRHSIMSRLCVGTTGRHRNMNLSRPGDTASLSRQGESASLSQSRDRASLSCPGDTAGLTRREESDLSRSDVSWPRPHSRPLPPGRQLKSLPTRRHGTSLPTGRHSKSLPTRAQSKSLLSGIFP